MKTTILVALLCIVLVQADIYMHSPRGSNDRNCERDNNRKNANRLFNSQNNAAGGYACPRAVGGPETVTQTISYYSGSVLPVEWTAQHGCGDNNKVSCEIVIQYMCGAVRDGTPQNVNDDATETVPDDPKKSEEAKYGVHESYNSYFKCKTRSRNRGLYLADQNRGNNAQHTRQTNGDRHGFECNEERDHYPYWHPTSWKDIAVITSTPSRCAYYQAESENVKGRGECIHTNGPKIGEGPRADTWYNNQYDCESPDFRRTDADKFKGQKWVVQPSHGLPAPLCISGEKYWSRSNHLGNGRGGHANVFNWTIPEEAEGQKCVLRVRYNISTKDFPSQDGFANDGSVKALPSPKAGYAQWRGNGLCLVGALVGLTTDQCQRNESQYWNISPSGQITNQAFPGKCLGFGTTGEKNRYRNGAPLSLQVCNATNPSQNWTYNAITAATQPLVFHTTENRDKGKTQLWALDISGNSEKPANVQLWSIHGERNQRWFPFVPSADSRKYLSFVDADDNKEKSPLKTSPYVKLPGGRYLRLKVNTNQYGRTFQDRSYVFQVQKRPSSIPAAAKIHNLSVRGKRGNIVQVYPSVEYDFVPSVLLADEGDFIHVQWTGSDYNPRRGPNDAEGGPPDKADNDANQNARADRSNMVFLPDPNTNRPEDSETFVGGAKNFPFLKSDGTPNSDLALKLAYLDQTDCLTWEQEQAIEDGNKRNYNARNCYKLNTKTPYFDGGLVQVVKPGTFFYMSTRNNNFSNRDQKGTLIVRPRAPPTAAPTIKLTPTPTTKTTTASTPTTKAASTKPGTAEALSPKANSVAIPTFTWKEASGAQYYYVRGTLPNGKNFGAWATHTCSAGVCSAATFSNGDWPPSFPAGKTTYYILPYNLSTKTFGSYSVPATFTVTPQ